MKKLHVLYDAQNDFALRCYGWLMAQPTVWPLDRPIVLLTRYASSSRHR